MAFLLSKLRIEYSDIIIITDITKKASESSKKFFETLIQPFKSSDSNNGSGVTVEDLVHSKEKTNRYTVAICKINSLLLYFER